MSRPVEYLGSVKDIVEHKDYGPPVTRRAAAPSASSSSSTITTTTTTTAAVDEHPHAAPTHSTPEAEVHYKAGPTLTEGPEDFL